MSIEQERVAYQEWADLHPIAYTGIEYDAFIAGYQAGRAALQSQDREDAARLDWLQQSDGRFFKLLHITSIVGRGFSPTNSSDKWFSSLREAIDHARRVEGGRMSTEIKRPIELAINLTPEELADSFWGMSSGEQAEFFNRLGFIAGVKLCFQLQYVISEGGLNTDGLNAMQLIGDYGYGTES